MTDKERDELWEEFDTTMALSVDERIRRGCVCTVKPVLDEGPGARVFDTMEDCRRWRERELPAWLGYRRVTDREWEARKSSRDANRDQESQKPRMNRDEHEYAYCMAFVEVHSCPLVSFRGLNQKRKYA